MSEHNHEGVKGYAIAGRKVDNALFLLFEIVGEQGLKVEGSTCQYHLMAEDRVSINS